MDQDIFAELRERIARLEAAKSRRRAYNQQDAAREANLSVSKFREERKAGRIKGTLIGRTWSFTDDEIQRYVAGRNEGDAD
jgi:hypothetical protein